MGIVLRTDRWELLGWLGLQVLILGGIAALDALTAFVMAQAERQVAHRQAQWAVLRSTPRATVAPTRLAALIAPAAGGPRPVAPALPRPASTMLHVRPVARNDLTRAPCTRSARPLGMLVTDRATCGYTEPRHACLGGEAGGTGRMGDRVAVRTGDRCCRAGARGAAARADRGMRHARRHRWHVLQRPRFFVRGEATCATRRRECTPSRVHSAVLERADR